jgi:hypothetical protein
MLNLKIFKLTHYMDLFCGFGDQTQGPCTILGKRSTTALYFQLLIFFLKLPLYEKVTKGFKTTTLYT